jgi:hypothetical protein
MNIRRLVLDVDKAKIRPSMVELAEAISSCRGVKGVNITVGEIDLETVDMDIAIEGDNLDYDLIEKAIESAGAVVHSIDQLLCGEKLVEYVKRAR